MKKLLIAAFALLCVVGNTQAQHYYNNAIGLRANHGYGGLTYKYFVSNSNALDFTLHIGKGIGLTGLYEIHKATSFTPRLSWYYGLGAHVYLSNNQFGLGADGVIGLEYAASEIPFAISFDYIPAVSFINSSAGEGDSYIAGSFENWTFGIKYTFIKSDLENKRQESLKRESSPN